AILFAVGWLGGRPLFRLVERSFWSLKSLIVEPCYALAREGLQQLIERPLPERVSKIRRGRWRSAASGAAGILICALARRVLILIWPSSRWLGTVSDLVAPLPLAPVALANGVVLFPVYLGGAALAPAFAEATMPPPSAFHDFHAGPDTGRRW